MQLVLGAAGAVVGSFVPGVGPALGFQLGTLAAGLLGGGGTTRNRQQIADLHIPGIEDGRPVTWLRGSMRLAVDWVANTDRIAIPHTESSSAGGKGGGPKVENTTYTYEMDALLLITANPGAGCSEVYRSGELIWRTDSGASVGTIQASNASEHWDRLTIYDGNASQLPDPDYLTSFGVANAPAYRGRITAFVKGLKLGSSGQVPQLELTAVIDGARGDTYTEYDGWMQSALYGAEASVDYDPERNRLWMFTNGDTNSQGGTGKVGYYDYASSAWVEVDIDATFRNTKNGDEPAYQGNIVSEWGVYLVEVISDALLTNTLYIDLDSGEIVGDLETATGGSLASNYVLCPDPAHNQVVISEGGGEPFYLYTADERGLPLDLIASTSVPTNYFAIVDNDGAFWCNVKSTKFVRVTRSGATLTKTDFPLSGLTADAYHNMGCMPFDSNRNSFYFFANNGSDPIGTYVYRFNCDDGSVDIVNDGNPLYNVGAFDHHTLAFDAGMDHVGVSAFGRLYILDPESGETLFTRDITDGDMDGGQMSLYGGTLFGVSASDAVSLPTGFGEWRYDILTPECPTVRDTQESICTRCGLDDADVDASPLDAITRTVCCLPWGGVTPGREPTERMASVYFYTVTMSGSTVKFLPRGGAEVDTIPFEDLGARMAGDGDGGGGGDDDPLPLRVVNDIETPAHDVINYINLAQNYLQGSEKTDRLVTATPVSVQPAEVAVGMQPAEAKGVIDTWSRDAASSLLRGRCTVLRADYPTLEPGDCFIGTDRDGSQWRLRIVQAIDAFPLLTLDYVLDDPNVLSDQGITTTDYESQTTVAFPPETELLLLDGPILQDADDFAGGYALVKGDSTRWPGAAVLDSDDDVTYTYRASITESAVFGTCTTTLPDWTGPRVIDWKSRVTVNVGDGTLTSSTRAAVLGSQEVNAYRIGSEVGQFITATLDSSDPNIYTLSGLLRGSRGTEWAMVDHAAGEDFALLRRAGMRRVSIENAQLGVSRYYKGETIGRATSSADAQQLTITDGGLKPFAPIDGRITRDGSNNATLTIQHRTRLAVRIVGTLGISIPLGEETEAYQWDFYDDDTYTTLVDSQTSTTTSLAYSAAQQTSAGLTPGDPLYCIVRQRSAVAGLGYELRIAA